MSSFVRTLALITLILAASCSQALVEEKLPYKVAAAFDRIHKSVITKNPTTLYRLWPIINSAEQMAPGSVLILPDGDYLRRKPLEKPEHDIEHLLTKDDKGTRYLFSYRYEFEGGAARVEVHVRYYRRKVILDDFSTRLEPQRGEGWVRGRVTRK